MATQTLVFGSHAPVLPVLAAAPTDADFAETPPDGTVVVVDAAGVVDVYARSAGAWSKVTNATV